MNSIIFTLEMNFTNLLHLHLNCMMNRLPKIFLVFIFCSVTNLFLRGQGCSDAGFCTLSSFKPNHLSEQTELPNQLKFGVSIGKADHSISVIGNYLEYSRQIRSKFGVNAKLSSLAQSGNGISVFGLSDIYCNFNYMAVSNLQFSLGMKIPLTDGNQTKNNLPLPMDYQSSLGTFDLIVGLTYEIANIQFALAWQHPLTKNKNAFIPEDYPIGSELRSFDITYQYERSGDVLARISYPIKLSEKLKITPGLLPVYHLDDDKFSTAKGIKGVYVDSKGLTLNGNLYVDYLINSKHAVQFNIGIPFVVRDSRPDGLTRSFVAALEYKLAF